VLLAGELLASLRNGWDAMQGQFMMLAAGGEKNSDLADMLTLHGRLGENVERMTATPVRFESLN